MLESGLEEYANELIQMSLSLPPFLVYVGIFMVIVLTGAGLPVAEEIIVCAAGILFYKGVVEVVPVWCICYVGILIADSIVVYLGWHFGKAILHRRSVKRMLHPRRVVWAKHQVHNHGAWMIAASRFIPGSRYPTLLIIGMLHLKRWKFLVADGAAAIVSVSLQLTLGWWLGHISSNIGQYGSEVTICSVAIGAAFIGGYTLIRWRRHVERKRSEGS